MPLPHSKEPTQMVAGTAATAAMTPRAVMKPLRKLLLMRQGWQRTQDSLGQSQAFLIK